MRPECESDRSKPFDPLFLIKTPKDTPNTYHNYIRSFLTAPIQSCSALTGQKTLNNFERKESITGIFSLVAKKKFPPSPQSRSLTFMLSLSPLQSTVPRYPSFVSKIKPYLNHWCIFSLQCISNQQVHFII